MVSLSRVKFINRIKILSINMDAACTSLYKLAEATICLRRYDIGKILYEKYLNLCSSDNPGAWHGLAICLEMAKQREEANKAYKKALQLHLRHNDPSNLLWGGWCALKLGMYELAYELFKESAMKDPNYAYTWHSLAIAAMRIGRREEAEEAMVRYRSMVSRKPYDKRECEGLRMLMEAVSGINSDNSLMSEVRELVINLLGQSMDKYGAECGLHEIHES